jgi:hypothetical protein
VAEHSVTPIRKYTEAEALANGIELSPDEPSSGYGQVEPPSGGLLETLRRMTVRQ